MSDRTDAIQDLLMRALELETPCARVAFLTQACKEDWALRREVEELLEANAVAPKFLPERPETNVALEGLAQAGVKLSASDCATALRVAEGVNDRIGRYRLIERIGEGGCGVVYRAEQETPVRREVALKVIKLGMDTQSVVARFEAERQALALMDHPNIARVLDAGATATGRPFFVMELVRGIRITEYCDTNRVSTSARLELFVQVCQAVQHAHQKGIIHRDIKPSNVLVTEHDGMAVPKVIDFGIAKATAQPLTDKTLFTAFAEFFGTPAYMSPEQASVTSADIDTRADIYSLGVLLYELLTGRTPFDTQQLLKSGWEVMRQTICERDPPRPSTSLGTMPKEHLTSLARRQQTEPSRLLHQVRGDLDWIVMKCLEKDRGRRYVTANALAMDLQRHNQNEPVLARPPSRLYEFQKTVRRHLFGFAASAAVIGALVLGLVVSVIQATRARRAEQQQTILRVAAQEAQQRQRQMELIAKREALESKQNLYAADIYLVQHALEDLNFGLAQSALDAHRPKPGALDLRGFEWRYFWGCCRGDKHSALLGHSNVVTSLTLSPDGRWLASGSFDKTVKIWDLTSKRLIRTMSTHTGASSLSFSPDGELLAVGFGAGPVEIWSLNDNTPQLTDFDAPWGSVAFSPIGHLLAIADCPALFGGDGSVRLWDYVARRVIKVLPHTGGRVAFSPDGAKLAIGGQDCLVVLDMTSGEVTRRKVESGAIWNLRFSPDNRTLATTSTWDPFAKLWDVESGRFLGMFEGHKDMVWCVAFSPNGKFAATGSTDQTVRLWDVSTRKQLRVLIGHLNEVWSAAFSADGGSLYTGSKDESILLWDVNQTSPEDQISDVLNYPYRPVISPDSRQLAAGSGDHKVRIWDLSTAQPMKAFEGEAFALAWSADGNGLITLGTNGSLSLWDSASHTIRATQLFGKPQRIIMARALGSASGVLVTASADASVDVWDTTTLRRTSSLNVEVPPRWALAVSPDRSVIATDHGLEVELWDVDSKRKFSVLKGHKMEVKDVVFSPNGKLIATCSSDGRIKLWESGTGQEKATLQGDKAGMSMDAFSPDGKTLASCSGNRVKLWNLATYREIATFPLMDETVWFVDFTPDANRMLFGHWEGTIHMLVAPAFSQTDSLAN